MKIEIKKQTINVREVLIPLIMYPPIYNRILKLYKNIISKINNLLKTLKFGKMKEYECTRNPKSLFRILSKKWP